MSGVLKAQQLVPKLFSILAEGYTLKSFRSDVIAGLSVAIVALPLAMALAIASGARPEKGLITAIFAGFLISALGGSRYQIGGPTAAFIVVVLNVILTHGYDGLLLATFMAGLMLLAAGFFKLGTYIKYVPHPVITGFTSGIALTILLSQIKDLFGLTLSSQPKDAVQLIGAYIDDFHTFTPTAAIVGLGAFALMRLVRQWKPHWPVYLIGVVTATLAVVIGQLPVETIGSRFGVLPNTLPLPHLPDGITWAKIQDIFPSALTIAFLGGIEALLSAVVADGMTGQRHRSNMELVAQGVANCVSPLIGGLPATGAIARTATNIRSGAVSPIAGMMHSVFLLAFFLAGMPLVSYIPLAALAAVLAMVAINISEAERFKNLMKAPVGDRVVLLSTFFLTVFVDLSTAIRIGIIMAALLFMHRMAELVDIDTALSWLHDGSDEDDGPESRPTAPVPAKLPEGVEVYQISGPFFFGAASRVVDELDTLRKRPRVLILRMRDVPMMDASGVSALSSICERVMKHGGETILSGLQPQPRRILEKMGILGKPMKITVMSDFRQALAEAEARLASA